MDKVCPCCGIGSSKKKFAGEFCIDCYSSRIKLDVPRVAAITQCRSCGRIKEGNAWVAGNERNIERLVLSKVKGKFSNARVELEPSPKIMFLVGVGDSFVEIARNFELKRDGGTCTECGRKAGGYFEAIIQLRGDFEKIARVQGKLERKLSGAASITRVEELREGVDLYAGSKKAAGLALSELGFHFTTSNKLFGVRDGQRIYRTTFCVRV